MLNLFLFVFFVLRISRPFNVAVFLPRYYPGVQSDPEGALWRDPPNYWEQIVYPAYLDAHRDLFEGGDVQRGKPTGNKLEDLVVIEGLEMSMGDMVELCCRILLSEAKEKGGSRTVGSD